MKKASANETTGSGMAGSVREDSGTGRPSRGIGPQPTAGCVGKRPGQQT